MRKYLAIGLLSFSNLFGITREGVTFLDRTGTADFFEYHMDEIRLLEPMVETRIYEYGFDINAHACVVFSFSNGYVITWISGPKKYMQSVYFEGKLISRELRGKDKAWHHPFGEIILTPDSLVIYYT